LENADADADVPTMFPRWVLLVLLAAPCSGVVPLPEDAGASEAAPWAGDAGAPEWNPIASPAIDALGRGLKN